jgi:hypothetical protein
MVADAISNLRLWLILILITNAIWTVFVIWWMWSVRDNVRAIRLKIAPEPLLRLEASTRARDAEGLIRAPSLSAEQVGPLPAYDDVEFTHASRSWALGF